jgi:hypothetical protein
MRFLLAFCLACTATAHASAEDATVLLSDDFNRTPANPAIENVGNGWSTNSKSRAKGNQQAWLKDGALYMERHAVADHGVSTVHDIDFQNATIAMRFKLGDKDNLGINIADMNEKSVHAGHLCMTRVSLNKVEITDLKAGRMLLERRTRNLAKALTAEDNAIIKAKTKTVAVKLAADTWHDLVVTIHGDVMGVKIDGEEIGEFQSEGIAHPTKRRLRLAVGKGAWVDDVKITTP